ncbi:MAG TPA: APC family permease [Pyrinomonadaceae bacterium]|nr:APC family permease [Pyrinomonadaceae bacterium]
MPISDFLFGKPLATHEEGEQRVGVWAGIPMLGLDALASAAYGPEAALTVLLPLGALGLSYVLPITGVIIALLSVVYFSYRQTIAAYPRGGGSYTVARRNLGTFPGLLAAAALLLDYVMVVAIGISAGVGALVSVIPRLQPYILPLCLGILVLIALVNLRGVREAGAAFVIPTYSFVVTLLVVLFIGLIKTLLSRGNPASVVSPPALLGTASPVTLFLLLHAFSSGCTAMTGVEAISNGVGAFREPSPAYARRTLTAVIAILIILLAGIAYLSRVYGVGATEPGGKGYESILSQLVGAVIGKGIIYYLTLGSVLAVLALSANTGFADFPRLCRVLAQDGFLPRAFASRGRRLVFSLGIYALTILAGMLLIIFGGVTDHLIPLFAVGAFLAFTLSQAGMVMHWRRVGGRGWWGNMLVNGAGAIATAVTLVVILYAKFLDGAWITLVLIAGLLFVFVAVRRHYHSVAKEIACPTALDLEGLHPPLVVVPIADWNRIAQKALRFAIKTSPDVVAMHVINDERTSPLCEHWDEWVEEPARAAGHRAPQLVQIPSPYRHLHGPLIDRIMKLRDENPSRQIAVIIPELVERHWYHHLLHNQRAYVLKALLLLRGDQRVVVINVPWYLSV